MSDTRWSLQPSTLVAGMVDLLVEETGPERRGVRMVVVSRPEARDALPMLRGWLYHRINNTALGQVLSASEVDVPRG